MTNKQPMILFKPSLLCFAMALAWQAHATERFANTPVYGQEVHGGVGLIQMPTARMNPEGEFSFNYQDVQEYRFWSTSLQLFPWMETTMRYTDVRTQLYSDDPNFSGDQTLKDKGIDTKFRLWQESFWLPQVSVGFRDFGGTGLLEGEYVAMAKRWRDIDVHLGIGWGYLGRQGNIANPLCKVSDKFCIRPYGTSGRGGQIDFHKFFRGTTALYGGIEYQTPWQPLRLSLEYDGNDYQTDRAGKLEVDSPWNVAALYRLNDNIDLHLSYQRGNTVGFGASFRTNFHEAAQAKVVSAPKPVPAVRPAADSALDQNALITELYYKGGFAVTGLKYDGLVITVQGVSFGFADQGEFLNRVGRIIASFAPESVKTYNIVEVSGGVPMVESSIDADQFVAAVRRDNLTARVAPSIKRQDPTPVTGEWQFKADTHGFSYATDLFWVQSFGNPEAFYLYQGGLNPSLEYTFNDQWAVQTTGRVDLISNFDDFKFKVDAFDTGVPRVRTYVREYAENKVALDTFYVAWKDQIAKEWFAAGYAGVLETMYSGVGGEVLYRPIDSRLAWGIDVNYVQQRDFDAVFGLRDYKVATGFVSMYWNPAFADDLLFKVRAGRYLAGDKGATFELNKRFDSGIVVGAYAAKTNLSAAQYGEGSFTKGFFISIPTDVLLLRHGKGSGTFPWVPISRDGGQPLQRPLELYQMTEVRAPFVR